MSNSIFRKNISLLALLPFLLIAPAIAQEEEASPESEQPQARLRIRFVERPVAIEPGVVPQLPEIVVPDLAIDPETDPEFIRRSLWSGRGEGGRRRCLLLARLGGCRGDPCANRGRRRAAGLR